MDDDAGHRNLIEYCCEMARWGVGGQVHESDGAVLFATGSWVPSNCNGAFRLDPSVSAARVVDQADAFFRELGRGYTIAVRDVVGERDLHQACGRAGLQYFGEDEPHMVCRVRPDDPPPGVELRVVSNAADVSDFVEVNQDAYSFGMPPGEVGAVFSRPAEFVAAPNVVAVVAYRDGGPQAAALTVLSHGVAGVYWVGTKKDARRRGLGEAVTRAVTAAAFDRGAAHVSLQASPEGLGMYRRIGYEQVGRYRRYVRIRPVTRTRRFRWRRR